MPMKRKRLTIRNPYYVKPARLTRTGRLTAKEAVRVYLGNLRVALLRAGKLPSEDFTKAKVTMGDFAEQLDKQAYVQLRGYKRKK